MRILLTSIAIVAPSLFGMTAYAQPDDVIVLESIEERIKTSAEEEKRLREEARAREREVEALRLRLVETANTIQQAERDIASIDDSIITLEDEKAQSEIALRRASANASDILAAIQALELSRPPALLVTPEDANTAARAAVLLADAAPQIQTRAENLRAALSDLRTLTETLASERQTRLKTNNALQARRDILADLMTQKEKERDVAASLAATAQRETAALAARATTVRDVIQQLERLAHLVTPRLKPPAPKPVVAPQPASTPNNPAESSIKTVNPQPFIAARQFSGARGALRAPVTGRIVNRFGDNRPDGGEFEGMRLSVSDQAIVTAPFEGRVVFARTWQPIGNLIVMDVGEGYHILLMGVGAILADEGGRVRAGEPIARMVSGGSNLDLEIRKNGEPVNPALWLSRKTMEELTGPGG